MQPVRVRADRGSTLAGRSDATAITGSDLGLISRNLAVARISESVITIMFDPKARFVDYGGGLGFYVRLMRDRGFDFYYWDRYAQPMFARGFESTEAQAVPTSYLRPSRCSSTW